MANTKAKFQTLNMYVKDLEKTVSFYLGVGFKIVKTKPQIREEKITEMKLDEKSDFKISIIERETSETEDSFGIVIIERIYSDVYGVSEIDLKTHDLLPLDTFSQ